MPPKKILLVDDSPLFIALEKSFFEGLPYEVLTAGGGKEGLDMAEKHHPDVILLDQEMPDIRGSEVLEYLRQSSELSQVPVILVTGAADDDVVAQCVSIGLTDFLRKPFDPDQLLAKVSKALGLDERKSVSFLVRLRRGNAPATFARSVDLSASGMRVETRGGLDIGETLALEFFLPGSRVQVKTRASVVRKLPPASEGADPRYGIRFLDITPEVRLLIERAISSR